MKPSVTREEALAHFGVKGMKWGVRNKKVTADEIQGARMRQRTRLNKYIDAKGAASDPRASASARKAAEKRVKDLGREFDTSEDRVTAQRLSNGEKATLLILGGPVGAAYILGNKVGVKLTERSVDKARQKS